jgi:dsRNA-specific ribonuclease
MKGLKVAERWTANLLKANARPCCLRQQRQQQLARCVAPVRSLATASENGNALFEDGEVPEEFSTDNIDLPSPPPEAIHESAKLAALHARLNLPTKLPLETLSRTLIDPSADPSKDFNNTTLAQLGSSLLSYHVSEWLMVTYPRLPMTVLFSAMAAYIGPATLSKVATEWGVESAAAPGSEVDPGLLQFSKITPGSPLPAGTSTRPNDDQHYRRGISSRVVYDDEFGDVVVKTKDTLPQTTDNAYANFVRALIGSIYLHGGRDAAKKFIKGHILSRQLPIDKLFVFTTATRDLARLCARENFEYPVARLLSETGRKSRHPVFVVGIFSGNDKLGEGSGPSLNEARTRAAISALKAWYLYSPVPGQGLNVKVPSDVVGQKDSQWKPVHIDLGEIV